MAAKRKPQRAVKAVAPSAPTTIAEAAALLERPLDRVLEADLPERFFPPLRAMVRCLGDLCRAQHAKAPHPRWPAALEILDEAADVLRDPDEPRTREFLIRSEALQAERRRAAAAAVALDEEDRFERAVEARARALVEDERDRRQLEMAHLHQLRLEAERAQLAATRAAGAARAARALPPRKPMLRVLRIATASVERAAGELLERVRSTVEDAASSPVPANDARGSALRGPERRGRAREPTRVAPHRGVHGAFCTPEG